MGILKFLSRHFLNTMLNEKGDFGGGGGGDEAASGIQAAGRESYDKSKATPEELAQYQGSFGTGNLLNQIMQSYLGTGQAPAGLMSPTQQYENQYGALGTSLYNQTLQGVQNPDALYQSTLQPQLNLASDYINNQYNTRGLMGSGLNIEQMGRAGAELAIQEANARMQNRQTQMSNAQSLQQNIGSNAQQNISNLYGLYGQQQQSGQTAMNRQAGAAQNTAQYQAYPYQAQLGNYYGNQAAMQQLPGQVLGAGAQLGASMAL
jgi:hypothetical protein